METLSIRSTLRTWILLYCPASASTESARSYSNESNGETISGLSNDLPLKIASRSLFTINFAKTYSLCLGPEEDEINTSWDSVLVMHTMVNFCVVFGFWLSEASVFQYTEMTHVETDVWFESSTAANANDHFWDLVARVSFRLISSHPSLAFCITMPTIHKPSPRRARGGPGAVLGMTSMNRRRCHKFPSTSVASLDDLDFELENVASPTNSSIVIKEILSPKPKLSGRKKQKARNFLPSTTTPSPYNPTFPPIPSQRSIPQQQTAPMTTTLSHVRHTLLVDTRTPDTCQGVVIVASVLNQTRAFLSSMRCRGIAPYLLGCLHSSGQNSPRSWPPMAVKTVRVLGNSRSTVSVDCFCEPLLIHPSVDSGNIRNAQAVKVPKTALWTSQERTTGETRYLGQQCILYTRRWSQQALW